MMQCAQTKAYLEILQVPFKQILNNIVPDIVVVVVDDDDNDDGCPDIKVCCVQ